MSRDWKLYAWGMFCTLGGGAVLDGHLVGAAVLFGLGFAFRHTAGEPESAK